MVDYPQKPNLLIDIQAKIQAGKGSGFEHWAKLYNLKEAARTLIYLQEHGLTDYNDLVVKTSAAATYFHTVTDRMAELESILTDNAALQKNIVSYSKTRKTYVEYRKTGYSKKFKELHEADILIHQAAKKSFDELGLTKLPTVASLREQYAVQLVEKKKAYKEYAQAKAEMKELLLVKANTDRLLDISNRPQERKHDAPNR